MLNGHIDPTYFPIPTKIQPTVTATVHITAKDLLETNMPLKCHIYKLVHVQISDNYVNMYTSFELTTISNVSTSHVCIYFTLLA